MYRRHRHLRTAHFVGSNVTNKPLCKRRHFNMNPKSPFKRLFCFAFYNDLETKATIYYALIGDMKQSKNPCVARISSDWQYVCSIAKKHGLDIEPPPINKRMPERYQKELYRHLLRHLSL